MGSVTSVCSVRERTTQEPCSRPIGGTSHIMPLPVGERLGEGLLSHGLELCTKNSVKSVCSVRERVCPL